MEYNLDDLITNLYAENLINRTAIKMLMGMFLAYVEKHNKMEVEVLSEFIKNNFDKFLEETVLTTELKEEYLEYFSNETLKKFKEQIGI